MILDTCVVSELWRPRPDPRVLGWFEACDDRSLFLSAVTLGELAEGAARLAEPSRRAAYEERIDAVRRDHAARILAIDDAVALRWGRLRGEQARRGRVLPVVDALITATALVHGMAVVTRNTDDFAGLGVQVVDPWR